MTTEDNCRGYEIVVTRALDLMQHLISTPLHRLFPKLPLAPSHHHEAHHNKNWAIHKYTLRPLTKISIVISIFYIAVWFLYLVFIVLWNKQNTLQFILSTTDGASNLVFLDSWFFSKDENCINKLTGPIKIWYGPIISQFLGLLLEKILLTNDKVTSQ